MNVVFPEPAMPMQRMTGGRFSPAGAAAGVGIVDVVDVDIAG
jgi:hypothetical protein